jgi:RNA polymerase sigma-70 factor (ECF subfamily)
VNDQSRSPDVVRPDSDLLRGAIEGDESAFAAFCVRSLPTLLRYLTHTCRRLDLSASLAEDAAQEAFLRATHLRRTDPGAFRSLSLGWLIRVGQNLIIDWARRGRKSHATPDVDAVAADPPEEGFDDELFRALERLSSDDRLILELVVIEERPFPEVASRLGISLDAAYKRHQRALSRLRDLLPPPPS